MKLSIVVPVYNERATIAELLERVDRVPLEKEIIVVDDGSTDGTGEALRAFEGRAGFQVVRAPKNAGKGAALRLGISRASGEVVVFQDADLELFPEQLPELLAPIAEGRADVVYGSRFLAKVEGLSPVSLLANRFLSGLTSLLYGTRVTDMETCYKMSRREILQSIELRSSGFEIEPEITAKLLRRGVRLVEVPIRYKPRGRDEGKKIRWTDGFRAVWFLLKYRVS